MIDVTTLLAIVIVFQTIAALIALKSGKDVKFLRWWQWVDLELRKLTALRQAVMGAEGNPSGNLLR
jgi:hypothetical protein